MTGMTDAEIVVGQDGGTLTMEECRCHGVPPGIGQAGADVLNVRGDAERLWTTTMPPLASPSGEASNAGMAPSAVSIVMVIEILL